ncbi:MAG: hypothetical protein U0746_21515 [Gemmataceae bacterium]
MNRATWTATAVAVLLAVLAVRADDPKDVKQLIDRALEAAGGVERLTQARAYTFKQEMTTKSKKDPDGVVSKTTYYFQPPKKFRLEEESTTNGRTSRYIEVIDGTRGYTKRDGVSHPMNAKAAGQTREVQQGFGYKFVLNLRDSAATPTALGESKIDGRTVFGIALARKAGRTGEERKLYFDAETNLLTKSDHTIKLPTGGEASSEQTWGDHRKIDGIDVPHRVTHIIKTKEGQVIERVYSDFKFVEKHDSRLFDPP